MLQLEQKLNVHQYKEKQKKKKLLHPEVEPYKHN